jgi:hypothetical protein
VSIGRLVIDFVANTAGFETDTARATKALEKRAKEIDRQIANIGRVAAAVGAAAAVGFIALTKAAIDAADGMNDMSKATGLSVESLSQLQYAAEQSGSNLDGLETGLRRLSKAAADAADGSKESADAFKKIGVSVKDADGSLRSTEDLLLDVADVFSQYEDGAGKAALAQELFGKSGADLIPFLNQGKTGIKALKDEAAALGITISGETAQAADDFNDKLNKLSFIAQGIGRQIASELLPSISGIVDAFADFSTNGDVARQIAESVATAFKLIADIGSRVTETFQDVGSALGALAAAAVAAAKGDFSEAATIISEANADAVAREETYTRFREKLWQDSGASIVATAQATDEALKKSFAFGGGKSQVEEVKITAAAKIDLSPMQQYYKDLEDLTRTNQEKQIAAYYAEREALKELLDENLISWEQYGERVDEAITDTLGLEEFDVTLKKMSEKVEKASTEWNEFQKEAARNTQDIIADTLVDGFDKGSDGILKSFGEMIKQLVAQAIAADIAGKLFGSSVSGNSSDGAGWINLALQAFGFGGARATGGPVSAGMIYRVNEREPEFFRPRGNGDVIPLSKMGGIGQGQTHVSISFPNVTNPRSMETQQQISNAVAAGLATARRRNG